MSRPADPFIRAIVDHLRLSEQLPTGWHEITVPGVDRPVLVGRGGLVVLAAREPATTPTRAAPVRPWGDTGADRRDRRSALQLTGELVRDLVAATSGVVTSCAPVVVIADDHSSLVPRGDDVPLVHHRRLAHWLAARPDVLDADAVTAVVAALGLTSPGLTSPSA